MVKPFFVFNKSFNTFLFLPNFIALSIFKPLSPKIGLIRDGKTYSFLVNDKVCFTMNDTSIPETEANSPYVGAFNAAYELKEFLVTDDATIIDQKLGK